jgi:hypothetical protein
MISQQRLRQSAIAFYLLGIFFGAFFQILAQKISASFPWVLGISGIGVLVCYWRLVNLNEKERFN